MQSATAKRDRAQLNVTFSKIDAPIAGKISRSRITVGNLVDANSTVLTTIVSVDPMYVYFDVDERTMLSLARQTREGKLEGRKTATIPVYMGLTGEKGYPHAGTIDFLENRVNPETGTIRVRGVFSNPKPERGERVIEAGLFARVRVPISKPKKALLVNERAIGTDQGQKFVYVVDSKNEVVFRPIQVGAMHEGLRVVTEGLNAGEQSHHRRIAARAAGLGRLTQAGRHAQPAGRGGGGRRVRTRSGKSREARGAEVTVLEFRHSRSRRWPARKASLVPPNGARAPGTNRHGKVFHRSARARRGDFRRDPVGRAGGGQNPADRTVPGNYAADGAGVVLVPGGQREGRRATRSRLRSSRRSTASNACCTCRRRARTTAATT